MENGDRKLEQPKYRLVGTYNLEKPTSFHLCMGSYIELLLKNNRKPFAKIYFTEERRIVIEGADGQVYSDVLFPRGIGESVVIGRDFFKYYPLFFGSGIHSQVSGRHLELTFADTGRDNNNSLPYPIIQFKDVGSKNGTLGKYFVRDDGGDDDASKTLPEPVVGEPSSALPRPVVGEPAIGADELSTGGECIEMTVPIVVAPHGSRDIPMYTRDSKKASYDILRGGDAEGVSEVVANVEVVPSNLVMVTTKAADAPVYFRVGETVNIADGRVVIDEVLEDTRTDLGKAIAGLCGIFSNRKKGAKQSSPPPQSKLSFSIEKCGRGGKLPFILVNRGEEELVFSIVPSKARSIKIPPESNGGTQSRR